MFINSKQIPSSGVTVREPSAFILSGNDARRPPLHSAAVSWLLDGLSRNRQIPSKTNISGVRAFIWHWSAFVTSHHVHVQGKARQSR